MSDEGGRWAVSIFGDSTRSGSWRTGTRSRAVAIFGDSILDLRGATAGEEMFLTAVAGFGDVRVMVPAGSRVEVSGFALFGSKHSEVAGDAAADGPVLRVKAWAIFGDVSIT